MVDCETGEKKKGKKNSTSCCIVRLRKERVDECLQMYRGQRWLDEKGEPTAAVCRLSIIKVVQNKGLNWDSVVYITYIKYCALQHELIKKLQPLILFLIHLSYNFRVTQISNHTQ